jgi:nicotinate-nucleotide adenylyltransferase
MKIGLFGGTFDPVHLGHEALLKNFISKLGLDKVFVIPVYVSPFKIKSPPKASPKDRVALLMIAFENESKIEILTIESEKKEISYTVDTIREILLKFPGNEFFLLLSEEIREGFPLWKDVHEIKKMVKVEFEKSTLPVSSTKVREKILKKEPCEEFLSPKVLDYIRKHQLYSL